MKTQQPLLITSVTAAAALSAAHFATLGGAVPGAGVWCPGVVQADADSGEQAGIGTHGILLITAGAAITAGDEVETDNQGRAITLAAGVSLGRALDAAAAAGDVIRMLR